METPIDSTRNDADNINFVRNVLSGSHW
jgi:hypothetical protein